ncbi:MAG: hypothetical protein GY869_22685, partial [Planctomycetes bacterium]|nr:hypothetical protein [Planctomycetota bacterium]
IVYSIEVDTLLFAVQPQFFQWDGSVVVPGGVYDNSALPRSSNVAGDGIANDGLYRFWLRARLTPAGSYIASAYGYVILDTQAPQAPNLVDPSPVVLTAPITVNGTAEPSTQVYIFVDDLAPDSLILVSMQFGPFDVGTNGDITAENIDLFTGDNVIFGLAVDPFGNVSESDTVTTYLADAALSDIVVSPPVFSPNGDNFLDFTRVSFNVSKDLLVRLDIYDLELGGELTGALVYSVPEAIFYEINNDGNNFFEWIGVDSLAIVLPSGIYEMCISGRDSTYVPKSCAAVIIDLIPPPPPNLIDLPDIVSTTGITVAGNAE